MVLLLNDQPARLGDRARRCHESLDVRPRTITLRMGQLADSHMIIDISTFSSG
jgi:hypothetical protein